MKTKKILLLGLLLFLISCVLFVIALFIDGFKFSIFKEELTEKSYIINDEFNSISVNLDEADFIIQLSNNNENKVVCYEKENVTFDIEVVDGTLIIKENKEYKFQLFNFSNQKVLLYLNKESLDTLNINSHTGNILVQDINFKNISILASTSDVNCKVNVSEKLDITLSTGYIKVESATINILSLTTSTGDQNLDNCIIKGTVNLKISTGDINIKNTTFEDAIIIQGGTSDVEIENSTCKDINIKISTGDCELSNMISEGSLTINTSTGDVELDKSDAKNIYIKTSTGDITGNILTDKLFKVHSNTGIIRVPDPQPGGECNINTDTGDIIITITK